MITFCDISSNQAGINLSVLRGEVDALVVKATEGKGYVNPYCDKWVQEWIGYNKPWGFYHFARNNDPIDEAKYFYNNCSNYFYKGIPILDWEMSQTVEWVNKFVGWLKEQTKINSWIYGNPWRFNQGGVDPDCMRWIAEYPAITSPTFEQAKQLSPSETDGVVGAWQFCSDGKLKAFNGNIDLDLFYGDIEGWNKYAGVTMGNSNSGSVSGSNSSVPNSTTLENEYYKVTIERK